MRAEWLGLAGKAQLLTSLFDRGRNPLHSPRFYSSLPTRRRSDPQYARTLRTRKCTKPFERYVHSTPTSDRLFKRSAQRINHLLIHITKELDCQMERRRLHPGDARVSLHPRFNPTFQLFLESDKFGPQCLREFDSEKGADHFKSTLFMRFVVPHPSLPHSTGEDQGGGARQARGGQRSDSAFYHGAP